MAVIYYPSSASVYTRQVNSGLVEQTIGLTPDTVFVFTSNPQGFTSSLVYNNSASHAILSDTASYFSGSISNATSASYSLTASFALNGGGGGGTGSLSSSYALTASFALNGGGGGGGGGGNTTNSSSYSTIFTSSLNWITCSFAETPTQWVNITTASNYSFTASNIPPLGNSQSADILIYINNTSQYTCSLTFPSTWINVSSTWPTSITASKNAVIWLKAFDNNTIIGTMNIQI
jgi:hypothetical protein